MVPVCSPLRILLPQQLNTNPLFCVNGALLYENVEVNLKCFDNFSDGDEWAADAFVSKPKHVDTAEDALKAQEKEPTNQSMALSTVRTEPAEALPHHCE